MTSVTIIGTGTMGRAIERIATHAGAIVQTIPRGASDVIRGDIVVLAVPYLAIDDVIERYGSQLRGRIVVDIANPRDPDTNQLLQPEGSSAAEQLATKLPDSTVVKAFTSPVEPFISPVPGQAPITMLVVGDDRLAKQKIMRLSDDGVQVLDDGPLSRARDLERDVFAEARQRG